MNYFIQLVGAKLEILNALQYNLASAPDAGAITGQMAVHLKELAAKLKLGSPGTQGTPAKLSWPLSGAYELVWSPDDAGPLGYQEFEVHLVFEDDPDWRMVVNSSISIRAVEAGINDIGESNGSSYIATSSSG